MFQGLKVNEEALKARPAEAREAIIGALRELDWKRENDPLSLYFPHTRQQIFHGFNTPVKAFIGGTQSGKTTGGLADDLIQALDEEDVPSHLRKFKKFQPPFLCRIMAPSFAVMETVTYEKLRDLIPRHVLLGETWSSAYDSITRTLHFKSGSKFYFLSYDQDLSKMGGWSGDRVHYDEEPPERMRAEGRWRVAARSGDEIFTMTPTEGLTWTYDELWKKKGEESTKGVFIAEDLSLITVDIDDNPALGEKEKRLALEGLSREERAARKSGKFVALHGLIYEEFSRERHVIPEIHEIPKHSNVVVGIDPGIRNRAGVTWAYLGVDDEMVVFAEGYYEGYTVRQVAEAIHTTNAMYEIKPLYYVIDPASANRAHQTGRSDQMEYADHGIVAIAGQNPVPAGINRIKERLETDRLFITDNCSNLIEELQQYRWKAPPRSGEDGPQKAVKKDDHLLDSLRYLVSSRPYLPAVKEELEETELEKMFREDREHPEKEPQTDFGAVFS